MNFVSCSVKEEVGDVVRDQESSKARSSDSEDENRVEQTNRDENLAGCPFSCTQCTINFQYKDQLERHLIEHKSTEVRNIQEKFNEVSSTDRHIFPENELVLKDRVSNLCCVYCDQTFVVEDQLKSHMEIHSGNVECSKDLDSAIATTKNKFQDNSASNEENKNIIHCNMCPKMFNSNEAFKQHKRVHFNPYVCDYCASTFGTKSHLRDHLLRHLDMEDPYQKIGKGYKLKKPETKPPKHETGPVKCRYCPKMYKSPAIRRLHERVHINPLVCPYCDAHFDTKSHLNGHVKAHLARENPHEPIRLKIDPSLKKYRCSLCPAMFKTKPGFQQHCQSKHLQDGWFDDETNDTRECDSDFNWEPLDEESDIKREISSNGSQSPPIGEVTVVPVKINEIFLEAEDTSENPTRKHFQQYICKCGETFLSLLALVKHESEKHFNSFKEMVIGSKELLLKVIEQSMVENVKIEKEDSSSWADPEDSNWYPEPEIIQEDIKEEENSEQSWSLDNDTDDMESDDDKPLIRKVLKSKSMKNKDLKKQKNSAPKPISGTSKKSAEAKQKDMELKSEIKEKVRDGLACNICYMEFDEKSLMEEHNSRAHSDPTKLICDICQKQFLHRNTLQYHILRHQNKRFYCNFCAAKLSTLEELEKHKKGHENDPETICPHCGISCKGNERLRRHIQRNHKEKPPRYFCQSCGKGYHYLSGLRDHEIMHNPNPSKLFKCPLCPMEFKRRQALNRHKDIHDESTKKIKCMHCDKMFRRKTHLQAHIKSHTGERSEVCQLCNESFTERRALNRHYERTHGFPLPGYNKKVTK